MISLFWDFVIILHSWNTGTSSPLPCGYHLPRTQGRNRDEHRQILRRSRARRLFKPGYACHTSHHITSHPASASASASHVPEGLYIRVPLALGPLQGRKITCSGRSLVPEFITARHADALLIDHCMAWRTTAIGCVACRRYRYRVRLRLELDRRWLLCTEY